MYGCINPKNEVDEYRKQWLAKLVPMLLSEANPYFSLSGSHFKIEKAKENTARIVVFK